LKKLYGDVLDIIETARNKLFRIANVSIVQSYWNIGRLMIEEEQNGADRAAYGKQVVELLSARLQTAYGKGYNKTNLWYMRQFYKLFENLHALRGELPLSLAAEYLPLGVNRQNLFLGLKTLTARAF